MVPLPSCKFEGRGEGERGGGGGGGREMEYNWVIMLRAMTYCQEGVIMAVY